MTPSEMKLLAQQAASIWDVRDFNKLYEVYDANCVHHQQSEHYNCTIQGIDQWRNCMKEFLQKYPEYQEKIVHQVAEGDRVVSILECSVSKITWSGVTIDRISGGKIAETWVWFKRIKNGSA